MGTLYRDIGDKIETEDFLFKNLPNGLTAYVSEDSDRLWQRAVTDGKNFLWIESHDGRITHFLRWGVNDASGIINKLQQRFHTTIVSEHDNRFYQI